MRGSSDTRQPPITVLLVDDHAVVLRGLRFFLETEADIEVVGEAGDGRSALEAVERLRPDVVLMDLVMPGIDGVQATREVVRAYPETKVIVLTSFSEQDRVVPAIQAGAAGYLLKDVAPDALAEAIRAVHRGEARLHPRIAQALMIQVGRGPQGDGPGRGEDPHATLTPREAEVLALLAQGRSNKEIAAELSIAETTVKTPVSNILGKLGLQDRTQAAVYAVKRGLVSESSGAGTPGD